MEFQLHPRLQKSTFEIGVMGGCRLLLKNHAQFPWFLLVPEVEDGIEDLHQLSDEKYHQVMMNIRKVSLFMVEYFNLEKMNVASIGNQVRQMHIHLVGRNVDDPAWPGVVWAYEGKCEYAPDVAAQICEDAKVLLDQSSGYDLVAKLDRRVKIPSVSLTPIDL